MNKEEITPDRIPKYKNLNPKNEFNPLERFIYNNEPEGIDSAFYFRSNLADLLNWHADKQTATLQQELDRLKNPWVSVKERLPEIGKEVITLDDSFTNIASLKTTGIWRSAIDGEEVSGITQWCEIPPTC